jgi:hypothetical protein
MSDYKPENFDTMINPQIVEATIGKRTLRKVKLYPLSLGDEIKITNIFNEVVSVLFAAIAMKEEGEQSVNVVAIVTTLFKIIRENLGTVLSLVTDEDGNELVNEVTNTQAEQIIDTIIKVNFGEISKNLKSLLDKAKATFQSGRQS